MARQETASTIINDTAIEVGLIPVIDPYSSQDAAFQQLAGLLNAAGRELVDMYPWETMQRQHTIVTAPGDTGSYALPTDFHHMIGQTGWNQSARMPIGGPLSSQMWAYANALDLGATTLQVSFILNENKFVVYPSPPPEGITISFSYISRNWVKQTDNTYTDRASTGTDTILFEPILVVKFLKVKFLAAKGFDIAVAARDFDLCYSSWTGYDKGAPILSLNGRSGFRYLTGNSVPESGFGL